MIEKRILLDCSFKFFCESSRCSSCISLGTEVFCRVNIVAKPAFVDRTRCSTIRVNKNGVQSHSSNVESATVNESSVSTQLLQYRFGVVCQFLQCKLSTIFLFTNSTLDRYTFQGDRGRTSESNGWYTFISWQFSCTANPMLVARGWD